MFNLGERDTKRAQGAQVWRILGLSRDYQNRDGSDQRKKAFHRQVGPRSKDDVNSSSQGRAEADVKGNGMEKSFQLREKRFHQGIE
jgi:hypothetical protein